MNDGSNDSLDFDLFDSPIGWILVAAGKTGVALVHLFGADSPGPDRIAAVFAGELPHESFKRSPGSPIMLTARKHILAYLEHRTPLPAISLDFAGAGPFDRKVWQALLEIPFGQTRTYKEIAAAAGSAKAVRAVGGACGRNRLPILVPCHRVIRSGGGLGGFSGGLNIKKALLDLERSA